MPRQKRQIQPAEPVEARNVNALLGPAPLLDGEDAEAYDELYKRARSAVAPADAIDEIYLRDVVDLIWEAARYKRLKAKLMQSIVGEGLEALLRSLNLFSGELAATAAKWAVGDREAVKEINGLLRYLKLDSEAIYAHALAQRLDDFERLEKLIMQAEARRNAMLREIDRRREALGPRLREGAATIEAEFSEIPPAVETAA